MDIFLPKWILKRYLHLFKHFQTKSFTFEQAEAALRDEFEDSKPIVSLVLSQLRRAHWLQASINAEDARKRNYTLCLPENVFKKYISEEEGREVEVVNNR